MSDSNNNLQSELDQRFMAASLRYAYRHRGLTGTNPSVGTLLVDFSKKSTPIIIGAGATAIGGRPHAETLALEEAGSRAKGATAYVSLEPCAHHGGTPPCAEALIKAGVKRVVTAYVDPDQRVDGKGHQMMRDAGITVDVGLLQDQAAWDMRGYLSRVKRGRPHVMLKLAMTRDGYLGHHGMGQVKITGPLAKTQTHLLRMQNNAILVGGNTVNEDDPELSVRLSGLSHTSPQIFILSNSGNLLKNAKMLKNRVSVMGSCRSVHKTWIGSGANFMGIEAVNGNLALEDVLEDLAELGIASLMIEGGAKTASSFLDRGLVDELVLYQSPKKIKTLLKGDLANAIASPIRPDEASQTWHLREQYMLGNDECFIFSKKEGL